ncbi:MAG: hypothetical protein ACJ71Q_20080 [Terriglobales bacterium]
MNLGASMGTQAAHPAYPFYWTGDSQMGNGQIISLLLGSAAIGALISSGITELGRWRERKARREELLLAKAVEMAHFRFQAATEHANKFGGAVQPEIEMTEEYHGNLKSIFETGFLPETYKRGTPVGPKK